MLLYFYTVGIKNFQRLEKYRKEVFIRMYSTYSTNFY